MDCRRGGLCLLLAWLACGAWAQDADTLLAEARRYREEETSDLALQRYARFLHDYPEDPRAPEVALDELTLQIETWRSSVDRRVLVDVWRRYSVRYRGTAHEIRACLAALDSEALYGSTDEICDRLIVALHHLAPEFTKPGADREMWAELLYRAGKAVLSFRRDRWTDGRWCLLTAANLAPGPALQAKAWLYLGSHLAYRGVDRQPETPQAAIDAARRRNRHEARQILQRVIRRYPDTPSAPAAMKELSALAEDDDDLATAERLLRELLRRWPDSQIAAQARSSLAWRIEPEADIDWQPSWISVLSPGERWTTTVTCRNLARLQARLHPCTIDAWFAAMLREPDEDAFKQQVACRRPVLQWSAAVPTDGREHDVELTSPPLTTGTYVAVVGGDGVDPQYWLLNVTDLALVCHQTPAGMAVLLVDRAAARPVARGRVRVRWMIMEGRHERLVDEQVAVDEQGQAMVPPPDGSIGGYLVTATRGNSTAAIFAEWWDNPRTTTDQLAAEAIFDRPAYRPGDTVRFNVLLGRYREHLTLLPQTEFKLTVSAPDSTKLRAETLTTNAFSSASGSFRLPEDARLGRYTMALTYGQQHAGAWFLVEEYRKIEAKAWVETPEREVSPGETATFRLRAQSLYGAWLSGASAKWRVTAWRRLPADPLQPYQPSWMSEQDYTDVTTVARGEGMAGQDGTVDVSFPTIDDGGDYEYRLSGTLTDLSRRRHKLEASLRVYAPGSYLTAASERRVFHDTPPAVRFAARDGRGDAVSVPLRITCRAVRWHHGRDWQIYGDRSDLSGFRRGPQVGAERTLQLDAAGEGRLELSDLPPGWYEVTAAADDPFAPGKERRATTCFRIDGPGADDGCDFVYPMLLTDRDDYAPGETVDLTVISPGAPGLLALSCSATPSEPLTTWQVAAGATTIQVKLPTRCPEEVVWYGALSSRMYCGYVLRRVGVPQPRPEIEVSLSSDRAVYDSGETGKLMVETRTPDGRPVPAQVSLAVADEGAVAIFDRPRRPFGWVGMPTPDRPWLVVSGSEWEDPDRLMMAQQAAVEAMPILDDVHDVASALALPKLASRDRTPLRAALRGWPARIESLSDGAPGLTAVRTDFPDTVLWAPEVLTGEDGRAEVEVAFPDSLTTWRATGTAITADGRTGIGRHSVMTTTDLVVSLAGPRVLTQLDQGVVSALVANRTDHERTVELRFEVEGAELQDSGDQTLTVPANRTVRVDRRLDTPRTGEATITLRADSGKLHDAVRHTLPIVPHGAEAVVGAAGLATAGTPGSASLTLPSARRPEQNRLRIDVAPNLVGGLLDALPYVMEFPHECTEQRLSRLLTAVKVAAVIGYLPDPGYYPADLMPPDMPLPPMEQEETPSEDAPAPGPAPTIGEAPVAWRARHLADIRRVIDEDLSGLHTNADGGVGWFPGMASDPWLSVYAAEVCLDLRTVFPGRLRYSAEDALLNEGGMPGRPPAEFEAPPPEDGNDAPPPEDGNDMPPPDMGGPLVGLLPYLQRRLPKLGDDPELQMACLAVLQHAVDEGVRDPRPDWPAQRAVVLDHLFKRRGELTDSGRARLVRCLTQEPQSERFRVAWENLLARRVEDGETAHWGDARVGDAWLDNQVTATAAALRVILSLEPDNPLAAKAARWLQLNRVGTHWPTTKQTADAILALAEYEEAHDEFRTEGRLTIAVNGTTVHQVDLTATNALLPLAAVEVDAARLHDGENRVTLTVDGPMQAWWSATAGYYTTEDPLRAAGHDVSIERRLWLVNDAGRRTREWTPGEALYSGQAVEVELKVSCENELSYVLVTDPRPAGCEQDGNTSGYDWCGAWCYHELGEQETRLYLDHVLPGDTILTYRLRAESPGTFRYLPAAVEAMYRPDARAISDESTVWVVDR